MIRSSCFRTRIFQSRRSGQAHRGYICPDLPHQWAMQLVGPSTQPLPYWSYCFRIRLAKSDSDWFCPFRNKEASHSPKPPGLNNFSYFDGDVLLPNREPLLKKNSFSMVTSIKYWHKRLSSWMMRSRGRQGRVLQS